MDLIKSDGMKISLSEEDLAQLSSPEKIQRAIDEKRAFAFDIFKDQDMIGFALLRQFSSDGFFLWDFAIDAAWQGKGYGETALRELITLLKKEYHAQVLTLTYNYGNLRAKKLYEKIGFRETNVVRQNEIHEVDMELLLTGAIMVLKIREHGEMADTAAKWFHSKWRVPLEAYQESIGECLAGGGAVPQWYLAVDGDRIAGGVGIIENDFHDRKDLAPNACALYVEPEYRCRGIAGQLLQYVCDDMHSFGIDTLYLITDHTSFYEQYGWSFLCMVQGDDEPDMTRMYVHTIEN